ncbi:MAG: hypothetical protein JRG95_06085 [Deltaproteobacteria bacterium]|nr:hypothetical protein [Deltaproteobacteria bacterium]
MDQVRDLVVVEVTRTVEGEQHARHLGQDRDVEMAGGDASPHAIEAALVGGIDGVLPQGG